jgi:hypothetical protein
MRGGRRDGSLKLAEGVGLWEWLSENVRDMEHPDPERRGERIRPNTFKGYMRSREHGARARRLLMPYIQRYKGVLEGGAGSRRGREYSGKYEHVDVLAHEDDGGLGRVLGTGDEREQRERVLDIAGLGGLSSAVDNVMIWSKGGEDGVVVNVVGGGDHGLQFQRSLHYGSDGRPSHVENLSFEVDSEAPGGMATRMLGDQVEAAEGEGFREIRTRTAGDGNYVWPRMGFNGKIGEEQRGKLPEGWLREMDEFARDLGSEELEIRHVMMAPGGREFWKKNGVGMDLVMPLGDSERPERRFIGEYVRGKGYEKMASKRVASELESPPRMRDEIVRDARGRFARQYLHMVGMTEEGVRGAVKRGEVSKEMGDFAFVQLGLVKKEAQKYAKEGEAMGEDETTAELDYGGSKYEKVHDRFINDSPVFRQMKALGVTPGITISHLYHDPSFPNGAFAPSEGRMLLFYKFPDNPSDLINGGVQDFRTNLEDLEETIDHELKHAVQSDLTALMGKEDWFGVVSKGRQTPKHLTVAKDHDKYALNEMEYFPLLKSQLKEVAQGMKYVPKPLQGTVFRAVLDKGHRERARGDIRDYLDKAGVKGDRADQYLDFVDKRFLSRDSVFSSSQRYAPKKWRKAVGEATKALGEKGYDLSGYKRWKERAWDDYMGERVVNTNTKTRDAFPKVLRKTLYEGADEAGKGRFVKEFEGRIKKTPKGGEAFGGFRRKGDGDPS